MKSSNKMGSSDKRASAAGVALAALRRAAEERAITFVLGAGVSKSRGVPDWRELTRHLWGNLLGVKQMPAWLQDGRDALERVRTWAAQNESPEVATRLCFETPHPLADQIAIELLREHVDDEPKFVKELRSALYATATRPKLANDTLGVLAKVLVAEQQREQRRVVRVITFNADDHLEAETNRGHNGRRDPVVWPVSRESGHPRVSRGAHGKAPIPIYHLHGFLPRDGGVRPWSDAPDTLVFADAEYWATVASPLTFANRVMAQALHDSSCVFVGLSMHDVNLIRWLGVRYNAICDDVFSQDAYRAPDKRKDARSRARDALLRHFWIRTEQSDPHGLIGEILLQRGVRSVPLSAWGAPFEQLLLDNFGLSAPATPGPAAGSVRKRAPRR